ncbi:carbohydrate sulfotransferase 13 [Rhipicephalus microplus]|uniref:carbohydrate sulfotransferase 13 n=1 Tax=Rhipicephalus microplus TaxID=6941 RepID=UPI003F6CC624
MVLRAQFRAPVTITSAFTRFTSLALASALLIVIMIMTVQFLMEPNQVSSLCPCHEDTFAQQVGVEQAMTNGVVSRSMRIRNVCQRYASCEELHRPTDGLGINLPTPRNKSTYCVPEQCPIFIDRARSFAFCFISKVASTSMKTLFRDLLSVKANTSNDSMTTWDKLHRAFHRQTYRVGPRTLFMQNGGRNYFKALFVRHPFDRLVSAYIDKALRPRSEVKWFYEVYWEKIPGVKAENRAPTFSEFVDFILGTPVREWDEHWSPYYSRCQPCLLDYDFVGKLETADRDFALLFSEIGIDGTRFGRVHVSRRSSTGCSLGANCTGHNVGSTADYFATLSHDQVVRLYSRYFYDFELFGYDFRSYLTCGRADPK